jgi:rhodanese-related sulfurtransferase
MMSSLVSQYRAAEPADAYAHFRKKLSFETDCSDVFNSQQQGTVDFVLVDARGEAVFARGHVPGAINIPHRVMTSERMQVFATNTLFVVYCAGPHCNGADQAAMKLAHLGFAVKIMIGGITGWLDEGLTLSTPSTASAREPIACDC